MNAGANIIVVIEPRSTKPSWECAQRVQLGGDERFPHNLRGIPLMVSSFMFASVI
jgi:hypothetical protein